VPVARAAVGHPLVLDGARAQDGAHVEVGRRGADELQGFAGFQGFGLGLEMVKKVKSARVPETGRARKSAAEEQMSCEGFRV
jgi:hypothetical protein